MKLIYLSQGLVASVDDEDYISLSNHTWTVRKNNDTLYYAQTNIWIDGSRTTRQMHRVVLDAKPGTIIDHQDGNGLNNQKSNLRISTAQQNSRNKKVRKDSTSGVKGVYKTKSGKFQAYIFIDGKQKSLGHYANLETAAEVRQKAATELFGEFRHSTNP